MLLTAAERVRRHQILLADAAFDVQVNAEARALFDAWMKHLRTTRLPNDFFFEDQSKDEASGIRYYNTYPGHYEHRKFKSQHVLMCAAHRFSKDPKHKNLTLFLCLHTDLDSLDAAEYFGYEKKSPNKMIILYEYLTHAYDQPDEYFPEDEFYESFFKPTKQLREARSSFIHEYRHYEDDLQTQDRRSDNSAAPVQSKKAGHKKYINSFREVNARYAEWILSIVQHFQTKTVKSVGVAATYPDFKGFWDLYWGKSGYVPRDLKTYADSETKRRLVRRLYKFWDWAKTQRDLSPKKAAVFARKQIEDDEIVAPREF